ncbi:Hok/Gef family protein [Salmonella enterica]|nr:Hok/Gef family protein [Salmonella enterica]ELK9789875.1 Hok/Gef family protein [Salmonella enterica]EMD3364922.1 Hok/Gef family protein [Salmonella enterica]EMD3682208.1 Hok/Gef family protein [Salmonella enterica]EMD4307457.1 Hok/Gef family protein [Salmonella enterica]
MSQKPLKTAIICITAVLIIWMLRGSMCEMRFRFAGAEIAAFLQCKE